MDTDEILKITNQCFYPAVKKLESWVICIEKKFDKPIFKVSANGKNQKWVHPFIGREQICIIRIVRIISGLFASINLLKAGFTQEIAVLLRTICDFQQDISFLLEGYGTEEITPNQKKFIDDCILVTFVNNDIPFEGVTKIATLKRDKIISAETRSFGSYLNPTDAKNISSNISDVFSRYVHGSYSCVMELYGEPPPGSRFHMEGTLGTPRMLQFTRELYLYIENSYSCIAKMSSLFGLKEIAAEIMVQRKQFEKNKINLGIATISDGKKALSDLKKGKSK